MFRRLFKRYLILLPETKLENVLTSAYKRLVLMPRTQLDDVLIVFVATDI